MTRLFLLFTVVPALELFLLLQLGSRMGPLATFLLIVATGALGAALARREGLSVLRELSDDLARGLPPAARVVEGALVVAGGLLLITPGLLTDLTGLALVLPFTRRALAPRVLAELTQRLSVSGVRVDLGGAARYRAPDPVRRPRTPFDHPVS